MRNIIDFSSVTELPRENIEYLSSGLIVSNCENAFMALFKLISLPYNEFNIDTRYCTNMHDMFRNCLSLTSLNISGMSTISCIEMDYMFSYCTNLQEIICPDGFDLSSCSDIAYMFDGCTSYSGEPLHLKNVPRELDFSNIGGTEGTHYVIDSYLD